MKNNTDPISGQAFCSFPKCFFGVALELVCLWGGVKALTSTRRQSNKQKEGRTTGQGSRGSLLYFLLSCQSLEETNIACSHMQNLRTGF
jgi:hypothetical protein